MTNKLVGWINLYKPVGYSSFDVIRALRKILNIKKIGHAGTLDPFASGVLPIALGQATRLIDLMQNAEKEYKFTLTCGEERDTGDITGMVTAKTEYVPTKEEIEGILPELVGNIEQTPPRYCAIKINGERAYKLARNKVDFSPPKRVVEIKKLWMENYQDGKAELRVLCGKGTYIRSLGEDIARKLGSLGYVSSLSREKVGNFLGKDVFLLEQIKNLWQNEQRDFLLPVETVLDDILVYEVNKEEAAKILYGQNIKTSFEEIGPIALTYKQKLIALARGKEEGLYPYKVFNSNSNKIGDIDVDNKGT